MLLGKYYVQIKDAHIHWGERRKTTSRKIRSKESYIAIPASYAYEYNIKKGEVYKCISDTGQIYELKAAGSQSMRDFAKQFQGNGSLQILYEWYEMHEAKEGDYVVVSIFDDKSIGIEFVAKQDKEGLRKLDISGDKRKIPKFDEIEKNDFRLVSLVVRDEEKEHCNIEFLRNDFNMENGDPVTSLIIGANGSGKSFILKIIAEMFNALQSANGLGQMKYSYYELVYIIDGDIFQLQILNREISIHKNGELLEEDIRDALPKKVLAVSFMLNDKFPFMQIGYSDESIYEYLGVRVTSNASWTGSMNNKLADSLLSLAVKGKIWDYIDKLSRFLSIDSKISISCEMSKGDFFADDLNNRLKKYGERIVQKEDYRSDAVKRLTEEDYQELTLFVQNIKNDKSYVRKKNKVIFGVSFDVNTTKGQIKEIVDYYKCFKDLSNLKVFGNMTLNIYKHGKRYSFDESSSGEKHILYSFTNIYNRIEENSLILIDEPEISLHPNWQIRYVSFLKNVFSNYSSCHFIIASHSHYLVSDLNPDSSSLVIIEADENGKHFTTLNYSTYAWSAENILYNIFGVRTYRNYYLDMDVRELLYLISNNKREEIKRIHYLYDKLKDYVLDSKDPLNEIIDEARGFIIDVESE